MECLSASLASPGIHGNTLPTFVRPPIPVHHYYFVAMPYLQVVAGDALMAPQKSCGIHCKNSPACRMTPKSIVPTNIPKPIWNSPWRQNLRTSCSLTASSKSHNSGRKVKSPFPQLFCRKNEQIRFYAVNNLASKSSLRVKLGNY